MKRKEFIKSSGVICCAAASYFGTMFKGIAAGNMKKQKTSKFLSRDLNKRMTEGSKSPEWNKADKGRHWIKSMVEHFDHYLDEDTKIKLLMANGRACYINALGVADKEQPSLLDLEQFLQVIERQGFKVERKKDRAIIHYGWGAKQNPWGLSMKEGFCMCTIFESDTKGVSPNFCHCSTGYVKEGIERYSGRKVHKIEVIESILRGGKDCKFRIEILKA